MRKEQILEVKVESILDKLENRKELTESEIIFVKGLLHINVDFLKGINKWLKQKH